MKLLLLPITLLLLAQGALSHFGDCDVTPINYTVFNLCPFVDLNPFTANDSFGTVTFGLGGAHVQSCNQNETVWAVFDDNLLQCSDIAVREPAYTLVDASNPESGVVITFPVENSTNLQGQSYRLVITLLCNNDIDEAAKTQFNMVTSAPLDQVVTVSITGSSTYGCPVVSFSQLITFIYNNRYIFASVAAVIGLFLAFFGLKLLRPAIFILTFVLGSMLVGTLLFDFTDFGTENWVLWLIFSISLVAGLILGLLSIKYEKFAYFSIGVGLGTVGGLILYNAVILAFVEAKSAMISLYITVGVCALIGGVVSLLLLQQIVIAGTAFIGAYLLVRGISIFIGGFPPETYVAQGIKNFSAVMYAYIAAIFVVAGLGIYYQIRSRNNAVQEEPASKGVYHSY